MTPAGDFITLFIAAFSISVFFPKERMKERTDKSISHIVHQFLTCALLYIHSVIQPYTEVPIRMKMQLSQTDTQS